MQSDETQQRFVTSIQRDALGFAGIELMRRVIGMEPIKELNQVKDANLRLQVEHNMLQLAEKLILGYRQFHHIDQILAQL